MLKKPQTKAELLPSFSHIGEIGWEIEVITILKNYGVSIPSPINETEIEFYEQEGSFQLLYPHRIFLTTIGAVNFDGIRLYHPSEIHWLSQYNVWFNRYPEVLEKHLTRTSHTILTRAIGVGEDFGDDVILMDLTDEKCYLFSHDPIGLLGGISFDNIIRCAIIDLSWSGYGWPDPEIEHMASELKKDLFGTDFFL